MKAKRKPKTKTKSKPQTKTAAPRRAKTLAEASRLTGISRQTLTSYRKDGCPAFRPNGEVDLLTLEVWLAEHGKEAGRIPTDLQRARIRLLDAQSVRVEHQNQLRAGRMVDVEDVTHGLQRAMAIVFGDLERIFLSELPPALKGLDEAAIAQRCRREIDRLKDGLRTRFEALARKEAA